MDNTMATTVLDRELVTPVQPRLEEQAVPTKRGLALKFGWEQLSLGAILLLSTFLGFFQLDQNGYSNEYYASAVKSMLVSWKNFFFVSFDPGGFVTVDKPPVALWIQTLSAKIFGFSGVSLLLPEALAGVAGVALIYYLVKRSFGGGAGLIAALVLAVTPIWVVMNRHNNPESILILTLLLAAWTMIHAAETGRLRWLLVGSVLVGVAFNVKTLQAFIVLPAFYALYFLLAQTSWRKRIIHLVVATVVVMALSFSWALIVDLTPASQRPYVGSSSNNTEMDLIFNYNGLGRVEGQANMPGGTGTGAGGVSGSTSSLPSGMELPAGMEIPGGANSGNPFRLATPDHYVCSSLVKLESSAGSYLWRYLVCFM
jgi:4-amino-4-deoxy-L-arabinose transferase-like glycosyltransferase